MVASYASDQLVGLIRFSYICSVGLAQAKEESGSLTNCSTLTIAIFWSLATPSSYTTYSVYTV